MKKRLSLVLVVCLLVSLLSGCTQKEAADDGRPVVYASFYPVYDLTRQVVGDTVNLKTFMPIDKEPHFWEPTPKDMKRLAEADVLVVNGANMERWLEQVRDNLPDLDILVLSDSVELITYKGAAAIGDFQYMCSHKAKKNDINHIEFGHTHEDVMRVAFIDNSSGMGTEELIAKGKEIMEDKGELVAQKETIDVEDGKVYALEMGHESGDIGYRFPKSGEWVFISDRISETILPYDLKEADGGDQKITVLLEGSTSGLDKVTYDPHSWLSLTNGKKYLNAINDHFAGKYPEHTRTYNRNKVRAIDALTDLEVAYKDKFKALPQKEFVVTHYAYEYLAREFDLVQFPLQGLVSTDSPSLKTIRKALDYCNYHKINTIFYEAGHEQKEAATLADDLGGHAVGLTSMEYILPEFDKEDASYTSIMQDNLEKIYASLESR